MMRFTGKTAGVPTGTILIWFGAIVDIPAGFVICDGDNNTPNLQDNFIMGAGATYAPGAAGGTVSHTHCGETMHTHYLSEDADVAAGTDIGEYTTEPEAVGNTGSAGTLPSYYALAYIMKS